MGLFPVITWLNQLEKVTDIMWLQLFFKVIAMALFGCLFFGLRSLTNKLHIKKHGVPHPALGEKKWAL